MPIFILNETKRPLVVLECNILHLYLKRSISSEWPVIYTVDYDTEMFNKLPILTILTSIILINGHLAN